MAGFIDRLEQWGSTKPTLSQVLKIGETVARALGVGLIGLGVQAQANLLGPEPHVEHNSLVYDCSNLMGGEDTYIPQKSLPEKCHEFGFAGTYDPVTGEQAYLLPARRDFLQKNIKNFTYDTEIYADRRSDRNRKLGGGLFFLYISELSRKSRLSRVNETKKRSSVPVAQEHEPLSPSDLRRFKDQLGEWKGETPEQWRSEDE